jgi:hypothetical protein
MIDRKDVIVKETLSNLRFVYDSLPKIFKLKIDHYDKHRLDFENGGRIIAMSAYSAASGGLRGLSLDLYLLNDAAFYKDLERVMNDMSPLLCHGSKCIISSTLASKSNYFSELYDNAEHYSFTPLKTVWNDHPDRRSEEFREKMKSLLGEKCWNREYECRQSSEKE